MKTLAHLWQYIELFLEWEMLQTKVVEKIETYFIYNNPFSENRPVYEIMWKNMAQTEKPQMT
jgi:hypothetical protein